MSTLQPINSNEEYQAHVASLPATTLSVLYFHAPWAAPCAQMTTILSTLASTYPAASPPAVAFASINAEELPDVSEAHDVTAVPFVVLRKGDSTLESISGTDAARLRTAVEKHSGAASSTTTRTTLPPAQSVTRPAAQPEPAAAPTSATAAAPATTNGAPAAKNLSGYAPPEAAKPSPEELDARLHDLTHAAPVMLFMKGTPSAPQCGFSRQLVGILREHSVRYGFFNILADDDVRQGLKAYSDWPTFPQLYLNGDLVGGLDIVREEIDADPAFFDDYRVEMQKPAAAAA